METRTQSSRGAQAAPARRGGTHVAIIMDGNGRWASARGMPRIAGHLAGAQSVRRVVEAAPSLGVATLTLYAFSSDNWKRPGPEVRALMRLLRGYLRSELAACVANGVRVEVLGRRDRLPRSVRAAIDEAERATAACSALRLRLAVDYSSRDAIVRAAAHGPRSQDELESHLEPVPGRRSGAVDLLVRTGGEQRLSDFLLWESAYAELYFTEVAWPDFDADALARALAEFDRRQRRFGAVEAAARPAAAS